jgi:hypothetical protein
VHVKNVLTINTIFVALIAFVSIFVPSFLLEVNGLDVSDSTLNLQRVIGAVFVGYGVASWLMRNAPASEARRAFLIGGGVGYVAIALVFAFNMLSSGLGNDASWVYIVITLLLAVDFIYFGMKEPAAK